MLHAILQAGRAIGYHPAAIVRIGRADRGIEDTGASTFAESDAGSGDLRVAADTNAAPQHLSQEALCPKPPLPNQPQRPALTEPGQRTGGTHVITASG